MNLLIRMYQRKGLPMNKAMISLSMLCVAVF